MPKSLLQNCSPQADGWCHGVFGRPSVWDPTGDPVLLNIKVYVFMIICRLPDILLNIKVLIDKQSEQRDFREHQTDVTLIVNPLSLPLIFHGSFLSVQLFSSSECWLEAFSEVETATGTRAERHPRPLAPARVFVFTLWFVFFSHFQESAVTVCVGVCVCVFLGAIMPHSKITIISVSFAQCFNYFFLNHSGSRHHRYETTPQVRTQYQPAGSMQGRPLSHTIDKTSCVTEWIQQ